jgi:segregation and condensation protein B
MPEESAFELPQESRDAAAGPEPTGVPEGVAAPSGLGPEFRAAIEAIVYAAEEPVTVQQIASAVHGEKDAVRRSLRELIATYGTDDRGIEIREVAGGYKFYTKPQHHDAVRRFIKSLQPPLRLSMPALETLAVIAYKQPVTLPEIQEIRGVQAAGVIKTLLERGMITTAGRKEALGRPILYRTTKEFLMRFGLAGVEDLPSLKEFEALARAALGDDGIIPEEPGETGAAAAAETADGGASEEPMVG